MSHIVMLEVTGDGDSTTWLEPVTDELYAAAARVAGPITTCEAERWDASVRN